MNRKLTAVVLGILLSVLTVCPVFAAAVPRAETPDYKVAYYAFDCYHMLDENGKRSGYGYEMMQDIAKYLQCTFSYVGYERSAKECEEMLRNGEVDIYTAARKTPEREAEFAFSTHPAITSSTCMNVKVGNNKIIPGDYSTYSGIRVGLLRRHTYNDNFYAFAKEKGFDCEIVYYDTPTELTNALINDEVDALVNSYIGVPEDEKIIENFGETPYYIMVRKENSALVEQIDYAIDRMNVETPNWRTELYNKYYGSEADSRELTGEEQEFLEQMKAENVVVRGVMHPENAPYSWYKDGNAYGIAADIFRETVKKLGLAYEIVPVSTEEEYKDLVRTGNIDIWMDLDDESGDEEENKYRSTSAYMTTTMSILQRRGAADKVKKIVTDRDSTSIREIISSTWPSAEVTVVDSAEKCRQKVLSGEADGALLMSYLAQKLAAEDVQNRLRVNIVPGAELELKMGVNAVDDVKFYGIWAKTLADTAASMSEEIVQTHLEQTTAPTLLEYMFDHPVYLIVVSFGVFMLLFLLLLSRQAVKSRNRQQKISNDLAAALKRAEEATEAKENFFSKMSHDIRTPLNVVLGMTQIAKKYENDTDKLEKALENITTEGNYLLVLINSILDVNQLEHGTIELVKEPFDPAECLRESAEILEPLVGKKEQHMTVRCDEKDCVVVGDENRLKQILINIISNAIKYTDNGGHIEVSMECLTENRFRFICKDDGIGMTEEFIKHICEDYSHAEDSRVSKTQGAGLGMSVVKGFTDLMGGTLKIESRLGEGSCFTVEIPFENASKEQREAVLQANADKAEHEPRYTGKKVLLVEDNALNAEIAMELLQSIGLSVDWAENGAVGTKRFEASAPGEYFAVFMDMQMPVMDGAAATRMIRHSRRKDNDIPIFAMTANTFASDRKSCREAGMNGYIPKPVSIKSIADALTIIDE